MQLQVSRAQEEIRMQDERIYRLQQMLDESIGGQIRLEMQVDQLQQQSEDRFEQSLEKHNNISTQLAAIQCMLTISK